MGTTNIGLKLAFEKGQEHSTSNCHISDAKWHIINSTSTSKKRHRKISSLRHFRHTQSLISSQTKTKKYSWALKTTWNPHVTARSYTASFANFRVKHLSSLSACNTTFDQDLLAMKEAWNSMPQAACSRAFPKEKMEKKIKPFMVFWLLLIIIINYYY